MAMVAYILTWITGLIVLLTAPKTAKYQRWHAIQAIGLGVVVTAFYVVWNVLFMGMMLSGGGFAGAAALGMLSTLVWLATVVLIVVLAVKAYQGHKLRLPIIAGFADKNA